MVLEWSTGMEYWNGVLEWSTGMEYWTGVLDRSAEGHYELTLA
jgi:hypothetical protein